MKFSDLLPRPDVGLKALKGENANGMQKMPYLQNLARGLGRTGFGNAIADQVDTRLLGDTPAGMTTGGMAPQMNQMQMAGSQHQMQQPAQMALLQQFLRAKGGMM